MRYDKVNLSELVQEVSGDIQAAQPERIVDLSVVLEVFVYDDRNLMRVVLENLLQNAWKFTSRHPTAQISFGIAQNLDQTLAQTTYFMHDDGAGFNMEQSSKLFGVFQRLHSTSEFPGTGIGLATVQRIIHRYGGKIWAEGVIEQGATFDFTLPNPP
jgi:light-regulated signal transduction histidine kinase (bacteriophytochrome)